ncbi:MAG TPA: response regulator transcription factor [Candidatus Acidoferrales bacterium]|jgi:DNA-binding NarL/FixJ family response regulator|nr:response regulator transcription factor [Candidatus Acidoferrales bacterium]
MPVTLVIADETPIIRIGLRAIAESGNSNKVVAEAGDGLEALFQVEKLKPTILIANLTLARLSGLELIRQVCHLHPETKVIALSRFVNSANLSAVFKCGAHGFIDLSSGVAEIQKAIQDVHAGKRHLAPVGVEAILSSISAPGGEAAPADDVYEKLTTREREILQLAAEGQDRKAIAKRLFISQRTVETHRAHIMQKLGLHSQTDLVRFAIRKGIIAP